MISSLTTFPLTSVSNVFVDSSTMPQLLQPIAHINPIGLTTTAVRSVMAGNIVDHEIIAVLFACASLVLVFAPLSMFLYKNKNRT
jgi:ABC-2 type transport system permease protein